MLFRTRDHEGIESGAITMTVRAWRRPQARAGGVYRLHARGVVVVDEVVQTTASALAEGDAVACGYEDVAALLDDLERSRRGREPAAQLTRVCFHYEPRTDPRRELAVDDSLDTTDLEALRQRLEAMDRRSRHGPWTLDTLRLIEERPRVVSTQLATDLGRETRPFKADARKLKNLGLTFSHEVGYELSPRGAALLTYIRDHGSTL